MKTLHMIAFVLIVVGALNWGLMGAFNFNLVEKLLGDGSMLTKIVYILVGLSAVFEAVTHKNNCKHCSSGSAPAM